MRTLILCAHVDDEGGCSGTIARMKEEGHDVRYVAFSDAAKSFIQRGHQADLGRNECKLAMMDLDIDNYHIGQVPVRDFPEFRQRILESMIAEKSYFAPELVFIPSSTDSHQDHQVVCNEAQRAFKHSTILGYEMPQNIITQKNTAFIKLKKSHIEKKIKAMLNYKSQYDKPYMRRNFVWGLADIRGVQCGSEYAESFEVIRAII